MLLDIKGPLHSYRLLALISMRRGYLSRTARKTAVMWRNPEPNERALITVIIIGNAALGEMEKQWEVRTAAIATPASHY